MEFCGKAQFPIVSDESPKAMRKLCLSTKFPHQKIRWNYVIFSLCHEGQYSIDENSLADRITDVWQLWREHSKFTNNSVNMLYWKTGEQQQIILPRRFKKTIYKELHINMRHLGSDRTIQFIQEIFFGKKLKKRSDILLVIPAYVCTSKKANLTSKQQHHFSHYLHHQL